jgi:hypothetical protein
VNGTVSWLCKGCDEVIESVQGAGKLGLCSDCAGRDCARRCDKRALIASDGLHQRWCQRCDEVRERRKANAA